MQVGGERAGREEGLREKNRHTKKQKTMKKEEQCASGRDIWSRRKREYPSVAVAFVGCLKRNRSREAHMKQRRRERMAGLVPTKEGIGASRPSGNGRPPALQLLLLTMKRLD